MGYLVSFLPWIAYAVLPARMWVISAAAGLVIAIAVLVRRFRHGRSAADSMLEISTASFFLALTIVALVAPHSDLHTYASAVSAGWLALTAWGSVALRHPFTLGIAKDQVPPEIWEEPLFLRTNMIITTVWSAAFTVSAVAQAGLRAAGGGTGVVIAIHVAAFVLPMIFTVKYSEAVSTRARAEATAAAPAVCAEAQR